MTDPIADMLARIQNAYMAHKTEVKMPMSKVKKVIAEVMQKEGYLDAIEIEEEKPVNQLKLTLKYIGGQPSITKIKRISKPGLRLYARTDKIQRTLGGYGTTIISTSQGVMTDKEARKRGIGGELLCSIW